MLGGKAAESRTSYGQDDEKAPVEPAGADIRITSGDHAQGPFGPVSRPITGNYWCEGPAALRIGELWIVYFDRYREHRYGAVLSRDLKEWTDISQHVSFPPGARHGSILRISEEILAGLQAQQGLPRM